MTAWYGDAGKTYCYSGITVEPIPWTPLLLSIKTRVEAVANTTFNSVLLNYYRGEQDSVSWHSDDEPELGQNPVIASVSFGATRKFQFKHKTNPDLRAAIDLTPGSLLIMAGATQHFWKHQIPKTTKPVGARINLTFRVIIRDERRAMSDEFTLAEDGLPTIDQKAENAESNGCFRASSSRYALF